MALTVKAKRIQGDQFTAVDKLQIELSGESNINSYIGQGSAVFSIDHISGPVVTHGGGSAANTFLNYLPPEANGVIANTYTMSIAQETQGNSVIKVVCEYCSNADVTQFEADLEQFSTDVANAYAANTAMPDAPSITKHRIKTGEITLSWSDDSWV